MNSYILLILILISNNISANKNSPDEINRNVFPEPEPEIYCELPEELSAEIQSYQPTAIKIINEILFGSWRHRLYDELGIFVDKFGARPVGAPSLDLSIEYMVGKMKEELGNDQVWTEDVNAVGWIMGESEVRLIDPFERKIKSMTIGGCGETPGIEAEFVVARTLEDLQGLGSEVEGRIVVFNNEFHNYSYARQYRIDGVYESVKMGALGVVVRSTTPFSLDTIHHGHIPEGYYEEGTKKIPSVMITIESAEFLQRIYDESDAENRPKLFLKVFGDEYKNVVTQNIFGELTGREKPEEIVIVSGHIDSVNVGDGAMDDGSGVFLATEAVGLLKHLDLIPRRSIQSVLWTAEELGLVGAISFMENHINEMSKYIAAFEADIGTFQPKGLAFAGSDDASCIVKEILKLIGDMEFMRFQVVSSDISLLQAEGVPGFEIYTANEKYFWFHHSEADRLNVLDPDELDLCLALWTTTSYIISDLSIPLPRNSSNWVIPFPSSTTTEDGGWSDDTTENSPGASGKLFGNHNIIIMCIMYIFEFNCKKFKL